MWNNLKSQSPFAAPAPPFLQKVNDQFLIPLSTTRLLALSTSLHKSYIKAAKASPATMLPSHITTLPSGRERGQYLAIDLGGTNMRVALVRLQDNEARVDKLEKWTIPEPVKTGTALQFFNWIADKIVNLAEQSELDAGEHEWKLGVTWSFPFAQNAVNKGTIHQMGKGFKIPDILNASLTDLLHDALESLRPRHPIHVTALLNDAVATLLSHAFIRPTTRMGLICGTGTNATCLCPAPYLSETKYAHEEDSGTNAWEEFVLVNTEWSMFGRGYLPTTKYDRIVDEESGLPGFQPFEMMVSGRYIGEIIRLVCMDGIDDGAWSFDKAPEAWTAKWTVQTADCSKVESYGFNYKRTIALLNDRFPLHSGSYTTSDADLFKQICNAVSTRSASLVAASTIALLQVNNELTKYPTNNWTCPTNSTAGTPSPSDSGLGSMDDDFRWSRRGSIFSVQGSRRGSLASPIVATTQPHLGSGLVTELHRGENGNASMTIMRENGIVVEEPSAMDLDDPDDDEVVVAFCGSVMEKYHNFRTRCQAILDELVATHSRPSSSSSDEGIVSGKVSVDTGSIIEQRRVVLEENGDGGILGAGILAAVMDTQAHTSS